MDIFNGGIRAPSEKLFYEGSLPQRGNERGTHGGHRTSHRRVRIAWRAAHRSAKQPSRAGTGFLPTPGLDRVRIVASHTNRLARRRFHMTCVTALLGILAEGGYGESSTGHWESLSSNCPECGQAVRRATSSTGAHRTPWVSRRGVQMNRRKRFGIMTEAHPAPATSKA